MAGVGTLAREVERGERGAEADVVADAREQLGGGRAVVDRAPSASMSSQNMSNFSAAVALRPRASSRSCAMRQLRRRSNRCSTSRRIERLGRRAAIAMSAPGEADAGRRAEREPEVGERGAGAGAVQHRDAHRRPARHVRFAEQDLHRQQRRVDRGEHRDVFGRGAGREPRGRLFDRREREAFGRGAGDR